MSAARSTLRGAALIAAVAVAAGLIAGAAGAPGAAAAAAPVEGLLARQAAAWNAGDLDAFCALYEDDAVFVTPSGVTRGRQAVLERYRARYKDRAAMGTLSFEVLDVRDLGETRSVAARWALKYTDRPEASGYTLLVMKRHADGWRIVQDPSM
jgi:uncharacterized protein (TIGR02246 family)